MIFPVIISLYLYVAWVDVLIVHLEDQYFPIVPCAPTNMYDLDAISCRIPTTHAGITCNILYIEQV